MQQRVPTCLLYEISTARAALKSPSLLLLFWWAMLQDVRLFLSSVSTYSRSCKGLGVAPMLRLLAISNMLALAAVIHCTGALLLALAVPYPAIIFGLFLMGLGGEPELTD